MARLLICFACALPAFNAVSAAPSMGAATYFFAVADRAVEAQALFSAQPVTDGKNVCCAPVVEEPRASNLCSADCSYWKETAADGWTRQPDNPAVVDTVWQLERVTIVQERPPKRKEKGFAHRH